MASATRVDRAVIALCAPIIVILSAIQTYRRTYPDTAFFGGDTWEHRQGPRPTPRIETFEVHRVEPTIPLAVCFVDSLLLTVILFGHPRIPDVIDFLVTLAAMASRVWLGVEGVRRFAWRRASVESFRVTA
jgi:hypothetical protein